MRIGFDCAKLAKGMGKSIGIYNVTKSIVTNLVGRLPEDVELVVLGNEMNRCDFDIDGVEFIVSDINLESRKDFLMWELFRVNKYIKKYKLDRIVFPRGFTSMFCPVHDIILVHDFIPFFYHRNFPGVLGRLENAYIMARLKQSVASADRIITISEYSKQEMVAMVPKAAAKTEVILHGFDHRKQLYQVEPATEDYIIGVTSKLPHKNARGIVDAYREYVKISDKPAKLVLAGLTSLSDAGIEVEPELAQRIECKRFLEDKEYFSLFKNAKTLLFLSVIEGFGLPPLEAMELGVPVICSDRSSLPEVVRDAGMLVNPDDAKECARALNEMLSDEEKRQDYIRKGYKNLEEFRWEDKIQQYIKVLTER